MQSLDPKNPNSPLLSATLDQLGEGVIITDQHGAIVFVNAEAARIHGLNITGVGPQDYSHSYNLTTMSGEPYPSEELPLARAAVHGETHENVYWRVERDDGESIVACGTARPVFDEDRNQIGAVLTLRDETEREKEREALRVAMNTKDMLLKEIHHRVKNNLQLVASLLNLQSRRTDDPVSKDALGDLSSRVDIIADIHRELFEAGETDTIEVVGYLGLLCSRQISALVESFDIPFSFSAHGTCMLPIEKATSVALALNELTLNALKNAGSEEQSLAIKIAIEVIGEDLVINFIDNCPSSDYCEDSHAPTQFGQILIGGLERQLSAKIEEARSSSQFAMTMAIPLKGNLVSSSRI